MRSPSGRKLGLGSRHWYTSSLHGFGSEKLPYTSDLMFCEILSIQVFAIVLFRGEETLSGDKMTLVKYKYLKIKSM